MQNETIELYFDWLLDRAGANVGMPTRIMKRLFSLQFESFVDYDQNREADGKSLRRDFAFENNYPGFEIDEDWFTRGCSMLEMLIALSDRMSLQTGITQANCFWHLIRNMGLDENSTIAEVDAAVERIVYRTYTYDGKGGLFPLKNAGRDQRTTELLYQMYAYLVENQF